jgi:hypothetical protein
MIVREYYQNINTKQPKNYFERWYADLWRRRINAPTAQPGVVDRLMTEELAKIGATFKGTQKDYRFSVTFKDEKSYTMFVLRWS